MTCNVVIHSFFQSLGLPFILVPSCRVIFGVQNPGAILPLHETLLGRQCEFLKLLQNVLLRQIAMCSVLSIQGCSNIL